MADRHFRVVARDGTLVGRVEHVVAERGEHRPSGLVISAGGDERVLPLSAVSRADGTCIRLREGASHYHDLPQFQRSRFRVIDEEMAVAEELEEDFVVGAEEDFSHDDALDLPAGREMHTGAENPYRAPILNEASHLIGDDASDLDDGPAEVVAARTRRDMH